MARSNLADEQVLATLNRSLLSTIPDLSVEDLEVDRDLAELGFNSLDRADAITMTMEELGIEVPVAEFLNVKTIRELVRLFARQSSR